jgi:hypothetical protein
MNLTYTDLVRKVIERVLFAQILTPVIDHVAQTLDIKGRLSLAELMQKLDEVHTQVMLRIFKGVPRPKAQPSRINLNNEEEPEDSTDEEGENGGPRLTS